MDILAMVDLYYMVIVMVLSFVVNKEAEKWGFKINKQVVVLTISTVSGICFLMADYFFGVEEISQSYKRLILTFLVSTAFYDYIIKLVMKQLK